MAETIVMIHGMWGGPWYWQNYADYFESKGYRCVRLTLRYHDMDPQEQPDPRLGTTSLVDYADDLERGIRALDVTPILMGHSMGGLLTQMLGSRGLGKALILLTPASPYGIMALTPSVVRSFWSVMMQWGFWKKPMRQPFHEAVYSMLHLLPPEEQRETYNKFVYESGRAAAEIGYWMFDGQKAAAVDETQVNRPMLVVGAGQDRITPAPVVHKVAQKYGPLATYKEFPDHAHWVVAEPGWEEVAAYVADWLEDVLGDGA